MRTKGAETVRWCEIRASYKLMTHDGRPTPSHEMTHLTLYLRSLEPGDAAPTEVAIMQGGRVPCMEARRALREGTEGIYLSRQMAYEVGALLHRQEVGA